MDKHWTINNFGILPSGNVQILASPPSGAAGLPVTIIGEVQPSEIVNAFRPRLCLQPDLAGFNRPNVVTQGPPFLARGLEPMIRRNIVVFRADRSMVAGELTDVRYKIIVLEDGEHQRTNVLYDDIRLVMLMPSSSVELERRATDAKAGGSSPSWGAIEA